MNQALEFLIQEHRWIDEMHAKLFGGGLVFQDVENSILENNIYGVDLNEESVEIAKLSLWLRTAQKGRKLNSLNNNIKCGNSLIDNKKIAGKKAFNWQTEFPKVFANGGFDCVIGNPPYGVNFDNDTKSFLSVFDPLVPDFEIYIYFISLFRKILSKNGVLSYIFPNTFLSILYGKKYRDKIFNEVYIDEIVDLSKDNTFTDASVRTIIFSFTRKDGDYVSKFQKVINKEFTFVESYTKAEIIAEIENVSILFNQTKIEKTIIDKVRAHKALSQSFDVSQGLIPYDKYRGHDEYTIKNRIWHSDHKKDETFKKELKGGDVTAYNVNWSESLWISYGDWLAAPREPKFFKDPRVLVREITGDKLQCSFTDQEYYNTPSLINIVQKHEIKCSLKFLQTILNSRLIGWYHNKTSPKANKGLFPKILVNDVRKLPIAKCVEELSFYSLSDLMTNLNSQLQEVNKNFTKYLQSQLPIEKLSKKLQNWHELDFRDFIKELNKAIKKVNKERVKNEQEPIAILTKLQEMDWMDLFETKKKEALALKAEIDRTDKEIDNMVYELYGLSEEEIQIVENS